MKKYLTMIAAAVLTTACSNDLEKADGPLPSGDVVAFDVITENAEETRAVGEIVETTTSTDPNQKTLKELTFENHPLGTTDLRGFGVFASYTGKLQYENTTVMPDFMYNQQVTYTSGAWNYAPLKYWPNDEAEYVSFFAYAPYEPTPADDGRCIIAMSESNVQGDPWINYRLSVDPWNKDTDPKTEPQVDLLYGVNGTTGTPWLNQQHIKADGSYGYQYDTSMKFTLKHALACIGDKISIKLSDELVNRIAGYADVTITKVKIDYKNLTTKARLNLNSLGVANWKEIISGELTTTRTYEKDLSASPISFPMGASDNTTEKLISEYDGLFYIPLQIRGTEAPYAEVTVYYSIKNNANTEYTNGEAKATFPLDITKEGKRQAVTLTLNKNLDLLHLVYDITTDPATEPSYSRLTK